MTDTEYITRVVSALKKVPEKRLLLIQLANQYMKDGQLDYDRLADAQPVVNMAIAEAKMYGAYTLVAVDTLKRLEAVPQDVGP